MISRLASIAPRLSIVRDSAYQQDEGQPSSCWRKPAPNSSADFTRCVFWMRTSRPPLATAGRQAVADEQKAFRGLY